MAPKKRIYPHLSGVKDNDTNSALRILFDKVFGAEDIIDTLKSQLKLSEEQLADTKKELSVMGRKVNTIAMPAVNNSEASGAGLPGGGSGSGGGGTGGGGGDSGSSTDYPKYLSQLLTARADLEAALIPLTGICGAHAVIRLATYRIRNDDPTVGILAAKSGSSNNCDGYTSDIVVFVDGGHFDVIKDAENFTGAAEDILWGWAGKRSDIAERWRAPIPGAIG